MKTWKDFAEGFVVLMMTVSQVFDDFRTGRGSDERDINIKQCFEALGTRRSSAILGFHVLTGCDQISSSSGKAKTTWWKSFMKADEDILHALSRLGDSDTIPDLLTLENIERYVVNTYAGKNMAKELSTLARLCWFLFSKYQQSATQLPPTMSALKYKIFRSHYVCLVLISLGHTGSATSSKLWLGIEW